MTFNVTYPPNIENEESFIAKFSDFVDKVEDLIRMRITYQKTCSLDKMYMAYLWLTLKINNKQYYYTYCKTNSVLKN
jgi:hypothetical protein